MLLSGAPLFAVMPLYDISFNWRYWIEFALAMVLLVINVLQPQAISNGLRTIAAPVGRRYDVNGSILVTLLQGLFVVGILALSCIVLVETYEGLQLFLSGWQILLIGGWGMIVLLTKCGIDRWMNYIFRFGTHASTYLQYRYIVWQIMSIALLGYLLLSPMLSAPWHWAIPILIGVIYLSILGWKLMSMFGVAIDHIVFLLLYLLHAEILPLAVALVGTHYVIHLTN